MMSRNTEIGTTTRRYVAEGFSEDAYNILQQFQQGGYESLQDFMKLWKENKMSLIYMGRTSTRELYEFTNECFAIVITLLRHDLSPPVQVTVVYLLYCLYWSQPFEKYKIRLTLADNAVMFRIFEFARDSKLWPLCLAIIKLKQSAFQIVGSITLMGPDIQESRSVALEEKNKLALMLQQKCSSRLRKAFESDLCKKIIHLTEQYEAIIKELGDINLKNPSGDEIEYLRGLKKFAIGDPDACQLVASDDESTEEAGSLKDIGARRKLLKNRQMDESVTSRASTSTKISDVDHSPLASGTSEGNVKVQKQKKKRGRPSKKARKRREGRSAEKTPGKEVRCATPNATDIDNGKRDNSTDVDNNVHI